jgi:hypothetical protein
VSSLRHIRPQDDEEQQRQWREGSVLRLPDPGSEDGLLTEDTGRGDFDITGLLVI